MAKRLDSEADPQAIEDLTEVVSCVGYFIASVCLLVKSPDSGTRQSQMESCAASLVNAVVKFAEND